MARHDHARHRGDAQPGVTRWANPDPPCGAGPWASAPSHAGDMGGIRETRIESPARFSGCADNVRGRLAHSGLVQRHPQQAALTVGPAGLTEVLFTFAALPFILLFNMLVLPGALVVAVLDPLCGCGLAVAAPVLIALAVLCGLAGGGLWFYRNRR